MRTFKTLRIEVTISTVMVDETIRYVCSRCNADAEVGHIVRRGTGASGREAPSVWVLFGVYSLQTLQGCATIFTGKSCDGLTYKKGTVSKAPFLSKQVE